MFSITEVEKIRNMVNTEVRSNLTQLIQVGLSAGLFEDQFEIFYLEDEEIFEYYSVSEWLADKLKEHGQKVFKAFNLYIWGRSICGQSVYMDDDIQAIYLENKHRFE